MSKPKLCTLLGVEPMEEFQDISTSSNPLRVTKEGHLEERIGCFAWERLEREFLLENLIERGINRPLKLNTQQISYLRFLRELFYAETLGKDAVSMYAQSKKGKPIGELTFIRIPKGSCLDELFGEGCFTSINIPGILTYYEEGNNV